MEEDESEEEEESSAESDEEEVEDGESEEGKEVDVSMSISSVAATSAVWSKVWSKVGGCGVVHSPGDFASIGAGLAGALPCDIVMGSATASTSPTPRQTVVRATQM